MSLSVSDPLGQAQTRTAQRLFKPFNIGTWFVLGFGAWLSQLLEGSGGGRFNLPANFGGTTRTPPATPPPVIIRPGGNAPVFIRRTQTPVKSSVDEAIQFLTSNLYWIIPLILVGIVLWFAVSWVRARGKFIFLDNVAKNRAAIAAPWKALAHEANSFFLFEMLIIAAYMIASLSIAGIGVAVAWGDIAARQLTGTGIFVIVLGGLTLLAVGICFALTRAVAVEFLIPIMYLRRQSIGPAWGEFRTRVLPGNYGSFVLYFVLKVLLSFAAAIIMTIGMCLTCFIGALPYIGVVIFLPIYVFFRCYSLYFLAQAGPDYNVMSAIMPPMLTAFPVIMPPPIPPEQDQGNFNG